MNQSETLTIPEHLHSHYLHACKIISESNHPHVTVPEELAQKLRAEFGNKILRMFAYRGPAETNLVKIILSESSVYAKGKQLKAAVQYG